jgi:hypothetical protein
MKKTSITVAGGTGPKLPPLAREIDGTPDPELGRFVQEGAARYHLSTLAQLAAEADAAKQAVEKESSNRPVLNDFAILKTAPT